MSEKRRTREKSGEREQRRRRGRRGEQESSSSLPHFFFPSLPFFSIDFASFSNSHARRFHFPPRRRLWRRPCPRDRRHARFAPFSRPLAVAEVREERRREEKREERRRAENFALSFDLERRAVLFPRYRSFPSPSSPQPSATPSGPPREGQIILAIAPRNSHNNWPPLTKRNTFQIQARRPSDEFVELVAVAAPPPARKGGRGDRRHGLALRQARRGRHQTGYLDAV